MQFCRASECLAYLAKRIQVCQPHPNHSEQNFVCNDALVILVLSGLPTFGMRGWKSANKKAAGITDVREVMASPKKDRALEIAISQCES